MTSLFRSIPRRNPKPLLRPLSGRIAFVQQGQTENTTYLQLSAKYSYQSQSSVEERSRHSKGGNNRYPHPPVEAVFDVPIGKLHPGLTKISLNKIFWHINNDKSRTGPAQALDLLIRLLEEHRASERSILRQGIIFNVLKTCQKHSHTGAISAAKLLKALGLMEQIEILWDKKWPSFVLGSISKIPSKDAPYQAERLLKELEEKVGEHQVNLMDYTSVLRSYAKNGSIDQAQKLLEHMEQRYEKGLTDDSPNSISYSCVIDACANSKDGAKAVDCASNLIKHMENENHRSNIRPTAITYTGLLKTYANAGLAEEAEDILEHMDRLHQEGRLRDPPNVIHFSCVVEAWGKSDDPNAVQRAEALFDRVRNSNHPHMQPNLICYSNLLLVYKQRKMTQEAITVLKEMTERFISGELKSPPNLFHYNTVLDIVAKSNTADAPARAESLLNLMFEMKEAGHTNIEPESYTFKCIFECFSRAKMLDAAENLLHQMMDRHIAGHLKQPPNTLHYNMVLNMFAKCTRNEGATQRAEKLVESMLALHASGHANVKPDVISYTSLLQSYAREGRSQDAELLLQKMHTMHSMGDLGQPNNITYSVVLSAHANSDEGCTSELAQITFNRMLELSSTGLMAHPDYINYACIMQCLAKDAKGDEAKQLLQSMHHHHKAGEIRRGPDTRLYNTVLNALAKSEKKDSLASAETLLKEMKEKYKNGVKELQPDLISYTTLLKSYANLGMAKEAESMLTEMYRLHQSGELRQPPNLISHNSVMNAIAKSELVDAPQRAEALLTQIQERGLTPDAFTRSSFLGSFKEHGNMKDAERIWKPFDTSL